MTTQLHDFSPGILPSGLFWIVKVPDSAVQINGDTLTIHLENVPLIDAFTFPPALGIGITPFTVVPMKASFDVSYTKSGNRHRIYPTSHDPISPFNWAGEMWDATNSGSFSMAYDDNSFSASGSFSSAGNFGEMGTERNGSFVHDEDFENKNGADTAAGGASPMLNSRVMATQAISNLGAAVQYAPRLKGRLLVPMVQQK